MDVGSLDTDGDWEGTSVGLKVGDTDGDDVGEEDGAGVVG